MKRMWRILLSTSLAAGLVMAGCSGGSGQGDAPKEYVIGAVVSKTGPASPLGEPEYNTLKLLEKQVNEQGKIKVRLVLADDESDPQKAQEEANRLIHDENVLALIGSTTTGASLAMKGLAMENEVPLISLAASVKVVQPVEESTWVFKTPHSDEHAAERVLDWAKKNNWTKLAIIHDSNAFGTSGKEELNKLAGKYGVSIVASESYNTKDQDMTVQLTKIRNSGAQAMIVWGTNPGPAIIAKNRKALGMTMPYIGSHGIANQSFIQLAGDAAEGVVIPTGKLLFPSEIPDSDPQAKVLKEFYDQYVSVHKSEPTNFASYAYDAFHLIMDAIEQGNTTREDIRNFLENTQNWAGATGVFNFSAKDHNGLTSETMVMAEVKGGKWVLKK